MANVTQLPDAQVAGPRVAPSVALSLRSTSQKELFDSHSNPKGRRASRHRAASSALSSLYVCVQERRLSYLPPLRLLRRSRSLASPRLQRLHNSSSSVMPFNSSRHIPLERSSFTGAMANSAPAVRSVPELMAARARRIMPARAEHRCRVLRMSLRWRNLWRTHLGSKKCQSRVSRTTCTASRLAGPR